MTTSPRSAPTHAELCDLAVKWLRRPASKQGPGCIVAVSECTGSFSGEIADAIGFRMEGSQVSVLVEAKTSRADFLADARKPHRLEGSAALGTYRYYIAPAGLIDITELPSRWGLIEAYGSTLKVVAGHVIAPRVPGSYHRDTAPWEHPANKEREYALLVRLLARVGDSEKLQKERKDLKARLARSEKAVAQQRASLDRAFDNYWHLRQAYEDATGRPAPAPRGIAIDPFDDEPAPDTGAADLGGSSQPSVQAVPAHVANPITHRSTEASL